jgi:exosome complex component RRP41
MDGHLTQEEFKKALELAQEGCRQVYEIQRKTLLEHFAEKSEVIEPLSIEEIAPREEPEAVKDEADDSTVELSEAQEEIPTTTDTKTEEFEEEDFSTAKEEDNTVTEEDEKEAVS